MVSLTKLIGQRIRQLRKAKNLTQEELGEKADLQSQYIGGVERGERNISLETLEKIIVGLKMTPAKFFAFSELVPTSTSTKDEIIEIFTADLKSKNLKEVQRVFEIYKLIYNK
ncbi:helix-turn-helix domain-containing protein [Paenibacillus sp. FJAT-27812]|uniref:helix-turn-helix domain-containing protein n=1 Tax=Paenibacillus sp. FJAT-27812 TaxID=1684143 RepID=UPI0006A7DEF7|nr:helix-turn-helix transcriptional regulator [Paenibacillus sp. FJAT-27812]